MTPGGLQSIRDNLYCHLYDETVIDLLEDDRQRTTNIHQRMERHWLGSLAIPFASLYANSRFGRLKASFKLYQFPSVAWADEKDVPHVTGVFDRQLRALLHFFSRIIKLFFHICSSAVDPTVAFAEPFKSTSVVNLRLIAAAFVQKNVVYEPRASADPAVVYNMCRVAL
ncbi:hypothetical protein LSTR_LSTR014605 [Laodelphax striatellus]|uniref:Uncharacterized protein n=1 Tax=Laodelphax striatellus TaxID=195883 RepID=A0A482WLQ0_LAOST|nr:hypothetical protein LSTR_LSTR014605 [Laodelphax striatellus]